MRTCKRTKGDNGMKQMQKDNSSGKSGQYNLKKETKKITAKGERLRSYRNMIQQYKQNRTFQNNKKNI